MTSMLYSAAIPQAVSDPATLSQLSAAADVAVIVLSILAAGASIMMLGTMLQFRRLGSELTKLVREATTKVDPVVERSKVIAQNVEYISASVRSDVERVTGSVQSLSDRLQQASDRMEERIEEFNALMEVVQGEAEETFIDTASTVRGVRAGARELTSPRSDPQGTGGAAARSPVPAQRPAVPTPFDDDDLGSESGV